MKIALMTRNPALYSHKRLIEAAHGPVVMEVNSSPGLEGIETATGKDIAGLIIEYIENNAKPGKTRTRGRG